MYGETSELAIYLDSSVLKGVMFPNSKMTITETLRHTGPCIAKYTTKLFSGKLYYFDPTKFKYPEDDVEGRYVPVKINLILTNPDRTGLWLFYDYISERVILPGGYLKKSDLSEYSTVAGGTDGSVPTVLIEALTRNLCELFYPEDELGLQIYDSMQHYSSEDKLFRTLTMKFATSCDNTTVDNLYYTYKVPNLETNSLEFYYIMECSLITPLSLYDGKQLSSQVYPKNFIWLDKDYWRIGRRQQKAYNLDRMMKIIGDVVVHPSNDVRFSKQGSVIIDTIFKSGIF